MKTLFKPNFKAITQLEFRIYLMVYSTRFPFFETQQHNKYKQQLKFTQHEKDKN